MIIKEYRIPMPLDVDEYRIAQLYMIAKKSRLESQGTGSGVEIITNEPYENGPGGSGQFTNKVYHITHHLPTWLRAWLPKSLSTIKEEAWNAYPYSKNRIFAPFLEKFSIEIESKYVNGAANIDNIFELQGTDLSERQVDFVDFVNDKLYGSDYASEEDPREFISKKLEGRGPLAENWLDKYKHQGDEQKIDSNLNESGDNPQSSNAAPKDALMCVYKLCKVQFNYGWPIQYRVEEFIHDGIRRTLVRAHRQAWAWQDEWHGLTMDDIRQMERETQERLADIMRPKTQ